MKSSLIACEAIIRSALIRQEGRGAHYRSDFPKLDDERWKEREYLQLQQQRKWYCLNIMLRKSKDRSQICFNHMSKLHTIVHLNSNNNDIIEKKKDMDSFLTYMRHLCCNDFGSVYHGLH